MRKILFAAFLLAANTAFGQGIWKQDPINKKIARTIVDSVWIAPRDTSARNQTVYEGTSLTAGDSGRLAFQFGKFWGHYGPLGWLEIGKDPDLSAYMKYTDTSAMLSPYFRKADTTGKWKPLGWMPDLGYSNIEWFGASPANSAAANDASILAARNTGKAIFVPAGRFNVSASIPLLAGQSIVGMGESSILTTTSSIPIVQAAQGSTISGIRFVGNTTLGGSWPNYTATGTHVGISIDGVDRVSITGCSFDSLGKAGIYVANRAYPDEQVIIQDVKGRYNNIGFYSDIRGEYVSMSSFSFTECNVGAKISGGNVSGTSGSLTGNYTGVYLTGGPNCGHSGFTNVAMNHNTDFGVWADGDTLGYRFDNCDIYETAIFLKDNRWIIFDNCDLDITGKTFYDQDSRYTYFKNCRFYRSLNYNPDFASSKSQVFFENCQFALDSVDNPNGRYKWGIKGGYTELMNKNDVVLSAGENNMLFDSIPYNAISGNLEYKLDTFYRTDGRILNKGFNYGSVEVRGEFYTDNDSVIVALVDYAPPRNDTIFADMRKVPSGDFQHSFSLYLKKEPNELFRFVYINSAINPVTLRKRSRAVVSGL